MHQFSRPIMLTVLVTSCQEIRPLQIKLAVWYLHQSDLLATDVFTKGLLFPLVPVLIQLRSSRRGKKQRESATRRHQRIGSTELMQITTNMVTWSAYKQGRLKYPYLVRITTGKRDFVECKILYRVSKIGHSAKTFFVEYCTRQRFLCRVPETRQTRALGKWLLCRVLDPRQNLYTRHRLPVKRRPVTAFFAERLRLGTRQRFVFFVFNFFAEGHSAKM